MNNKKTIIILILVLTIGIVGLTVAYFSNSTSIDNTFTTRDYGTTTDEDFVSPDNWLPGTTTPKTLTVTNSGNVDEAVRISYTETWTSKNAKDNNQEGDLSLKQNNNDVAIINWANNDDWSTVTENGVTYKYYKYKLAPQETTTSLLDSVTFNSAAVNNANCVESTPEPGKKVITCDSTGNGYDGATYKLRFNVETVQYNQYRNAWGTNVALLDEKPLIVYGLNVNRKSKTYETGDKHQMFEFEHSATEQTPVLTDYRYIGNDPYNYVKFNCDNDGTNCEIWRIIGVFSVDDGTGKYENRIKLVRENDLPLSMYFDDRESEYDTGYYKGINEWVDSKLSNFLNNNYLYRDEVTSTYGLKELARSQIGEAKYYLGGATYNSSDGYGTSEEIYAWERGTNVMNYNNFYNNYCKDYSSYYYCSNNYCDNNPTSKICNANRSIAWVGKIAVMYPSDYSFTYSNGVDDVCYNDPSGCYEKDYQPWNNTYAYKLNPGYAETGWIYNSFTFAGSWNFLLSPSTYSTYSIFIVQNDGRIREDGHYECQIRPVVYLKSSIQILSGEGTEQDPYVLSSN